jgi:hypothetical protein
MIILFLSSVVGLTLPQEVTKTKTVKAFTTITYFMAVHFLITQRSKNKLCHDVRFGKDKM